MIEIPACTIGLFNVLTAAAFFPPEPLGPTYIFFSHGNMWHGEKGSDHWCSPYCLTLQGTGVDAGFSAAASGNVDHEAG